MNQTAAAVNGGGEEAVTAESGERETAGEGFKQGNKYPSGMTIQAIRKGTRDGVAETEL